MKKIIKEIILFFMTIELFEHAKFEFRSKLGRILSRSLKLNSRNANYINIIFKYFYEKILLTLKLFRNIKNKILESFFKYV